MSRTWAILILGGCVDLERPGTQTGTEINLPIWEACAETGRTAVDPDAVVPGIDAKPSELAALASGTFSGPFDANGDVTATLVVTARDGDAVRVDSAPAEGQSDDLVCPTLVEVPISVTWSTSDGALAEAFDTSLIASASTSSWFYHTLPAPDLVGTGRLVGVSPEEWQTGFADLAAWFTDGTWSGTVTWRVGDLAETGGYGDFVTTE